MNVMRYSFVAAIAMGGQLVALGLAFLFHFIMARLLGVALYGDFGVLLATFTILLFPIISVQAVMMREVAKLHRENKEENIRWLILRYLKIGLLFGSFLALLAFIVLFSLGILIQPLETVLILLSVPLFYAIYIFNSYFQGKQQPFHFVTVLILMDLLRFILAVALVWGGLNLLGVATSYVLGSFLLFLPLLLFFYFKQHPSARPFSFSLAQHLVWVFPTYAFLSFFLVADLFFVRHLLTTETAGLYNAALTLARGIFYAGVGLMNAFLPQSSKLDIRKDTKKLFRSLVISVMLLLSFALIVFAFKDLLIGVLYGSAYLESFPLLGVLVFSMFFLSLSLLFTNLMWSQHEQRIPFFISLITVLVSLPIFYILTVVWGAIGAAYASLFSTFLFALLSGSATWVILNRSRRP